MTEYHTNPLAIEVAAPRLSWGFRQGTGMNTQTAYQILVATTQEALARGRGEQWDSSRVESGQQVQIVYAGLPLVARTRYFWCVRVWNEKGEISAWSAPAWWEMGLLAAEDWAASWIEAAGGSDGAGACPQFRRAFVLDQPVVSARLAICGLGQYELSVNGQRVGEHILEPGWTDYRKACLYRIYDVTGQMQIGENVLGVLLGNGMYRVTESERYTKFLGSYGELKLIAHVEVRLVDGTLLRIGSDEHWHSSGSALTFSSIYGGEDYDARLEQPGWQLPGFQEDMRWRPVVLTSGPGGVLRAQQSPSPAIMASFLPQHWTRLPSGAFLVDFGQNFSGWVSLSVCGSAGASLTITPSEILKDGQVDQSEIGMPFFFQYTLRGDGLESWRPRFTYYGFRYALVEGAVPAEFAEGAGLDQAVLMVLTGEMISADVPTIGSFTCSNDLLNRIHHLIHMAIRSNMQNLLTDCPHREKLGWLEQVFLMGPSLFNSYGVEALYTLMIENMDDAQWENGMVPNIAPEYVRFEGGFLDSPEWGSSLILASWLFYQRTRDRCVLEQHYEAMRRYLAYLSSRAEDDILDFGLGDWCDIGPNRPYASQTPVALTATAFYYADAVTLAQISAVLDQEKDAAACAELAARIKDAYHRRFFDEEKLSYATGSQAACAIPLVFGLVPEEARQAVLARLVRDIEDQGFHTTAGDIGYRFVIQALQEHDRSDLLFALSQRREHPSYGFQLDHGATTLTEMWDGPIFGASQNHLMLGHIEEWFLSGLAGLRVNFTSSPALLIKPAFVPSLERVEGALILPEGRFACTWERTTQGKVRLILSIPVNQRAHLHLHAEHAAALTSLAGPTPRFLGLQGAQGLWELAGGEYALLFHAARG